MKKKNKGSQSLYQTRINITILCVISIALNIAGVFAVSASGLPLYLDTTGTVLAAVLGGYIPGIIVGFITNMIKGLISSQHMYYSIINMLTALFAAYFAKKGFFKKTWRPFAIVPALALIAGLLGGVLTWFLNDSGIGGTGAALAMHLTEKSGISGLGAQIITELVIELADKAITIAIAVLILRFLPENIKTRAFYRSRLSPEMEKALKSGKCRSVSLRTKVLLILIAATILIAGTAAEISFMLFKNSTISEHTKLANGIAGLEVEFIDANKVDEYLEKGEAADGYIRTEETLYKIFESSPDIEYIYVYKIMEDGCHVVFDLDTESAQGSDPGDVIEFDESFMPYIPSLLAGEEIEPIISNDSYGWLLTVYKPVFDDNGVCQCYAAVDISMNLLSTYGISFLTKLISLLIGFFIIILAIGMHLVNHNVIIPINTMAYCAGAFAYNSDEAREESVERIRELQIRTGDETENLYQAFLKTTEDSMQYVADIQKKTETISQMQNGLILVLADMVESRDKCTGDHVRKTAAYTKIIMNEMKKRGYYADQLTDQFIQDVYNAAPLHDIGKIHISDVILNKPGKLTDEEFDIMKSHTTYGSKIIDQAINMVPDSGYLEEAKNLSEYHHEKWNGRGYPHGFAGEDIPLSARIMAVADVFDALVSRRSYKAPFPIEKALNIIKEDAGTHFDPLVAEAFLAAEDKVREVAEEFEDSSEE